MENNAHDRKESIARELGYADWESVPAPVQNNIEHGLEDGIEVVDDAWAEIARRIAEAV